MKNILASSAALALILGFSPYASAQTAPAPGGIAPVAPAPGGAMQGEHREHHPEIHRAMHALENAKNDLQHADRDFDGHRTKAVQAIDAAINELHQALASDRH